MPKYLPDQKKGFNKKAKALEYEKVDIYLPSSKEPLVTERIYTAMTRAKKAFRFFI
jgi:ATP-dependent exoDNAse (exonuclease V) alpha subunit